MCIIHVTKVMPSNLTEVCIRCYTNIANNYLWLQTGKNKNGNKWHTFFEVPINLEAKK